MPVARETVEVISVVVFTFAVALTALIMGA